MSSDAPAARETRTQKMGLLGAISYIIGNVVGSGIFITPTSILKKTESVGLSLVVWVVAACISILGSFCYVELGTSIRISGADFAYMCYVGWFPIAFSFMIVGCLLIYPATLAVQAQTLSEYVIKGCNLDGKLSDGEEYWAKKFIGFTVIWMLMFLNFFSLKTFVSRFQIAATASKALACALVIVVGFVHLVGKGETDNLKDPFSGSNWKAGKIVVALFGGLFSYDGWDILNFGAEEIEKPKRTMPMAILLGMSSVAVIFLCVNLSFFVILDVETMKGSDAVAQTFAEHTLGHFKYVMPLLISLLLIGSLNGTIFSASRYLQAAARQHNLPSFISGINAESDSPRVAIFVHVVLAMAISFTGAIDDLIDYLAFCQWMQRAITMVALIWMRFRHYPFHPDAITNPIIMPIVFFICCVTLVVVTIVDDFTTSAVGLGVLLGAFIVFFIFVFEKSLPRLEGYQQFQRNINEKSTQVAQIVFNVMPDMAADANATMDMTPAPKIYPVELKSATGDGVKSRGHSTLFHRGGGTNGDVANGHEPKY